MYIYIILYIYVPISYFILCMQLTLKRVTKESRHHLFVELQSAQLPTAHHLPAVQAPLGRLHTVLIQAVLLRSARLHTVQLQTVKHRALQPLLNLQVQVEQLQSAQPRIAQLQTVEHQVAQPQTGKHLAAQHQFVPLHIARLQQIVLG